VNVYTIVGPGGQRALISEDELKDVLTLSMKMLAEAEDCIVIDDDDKRRCDRAKDAILRLREAISALRGEES
jgi:hypothetical protein